MENNGSQASAANHFEKRIFGNEIMVSDDIFDPKLSQMTLAVARDSGWYEVDLDLGQHYIWGRRKGCQFLAGTCSSDHFSEFCDRKNQTACDDSHDYVTRCTRSNFTETCDVQMSIESCKAGYSHNKLFYYGPKAKCLNTKVFELFSFLIER